jgi:hypothetical protein
MCRGVTLHGMYFVLLHVLLRVAASGGRASHQSSVAQMFVRNRTRQQKWTKDVHAQKVCMRLTSQHMSSAQQNPPTVRCSQCPQCRKLNALATDATNA